MRNRITLKNCGYYQFKARGINDKCEGDYSNFSEISMPCPVKVVPLPMLDTVRVIAVGCGFRFSWSPPSVKAHEVSSLRYDISI